jgi:hypothetical protein
VVTYSSGIVLYPSVAVSGPKIHVVWWDQRDGPSGNVEIYYKRNLTGNSGVEESSGRFQPQTSNLKVGNVLIEIDPRYFRPLEAESLQGDASKAKKKLKWEPKVRFKELVRMMVDADIKDLEEMRHCQDVIRKLANKRKVEVKV